MTIDQDTDTTDVLDAVGRRRFLLTAWPWRALLYLAGSWLLAGVLAVLLGLCALPLLAARAAPGWVAGAALTVVLCAAVLPVVAWPLSAVERARLRLVDGVPVPTPRTRPTPRALYASPGTWLAVAQLGLVVLLGGLTLLVCGLLALLAVVLVASPGLVADGPVNVGPWRISTLAQAWAGVPVGVLCLLACPYVWAVSAGLLGRGTRFLLVGADAQRSQLRELTRSRLRLVDGFDVERRRIERDLHDVVQQRLVTLHLQLGLAAEGLGERHPAAADLETARQTARTLLAEVRSLIRGIQPHALTHWGLGAALEELTAVQPLPVRWRVDPLRLIRSSTWGAPLSMSPVRSWFQPSWPNVRAS